MIRDQFFEQNACGFLMTGSFFRDREEYPVSVRPRMKANHPPEQKTGGIVVSHGQKEASLVHPQIRVRRSERQGVVHHGQRQRVVFLKKGDGREIVPDGGVFRESCFEVIQKRLCFRKTVFPDIQGRLLQKIPVLRRATACAGRQGCRDESGQNSIEPLSHERSSTRLQTNREIL